MKIKVKILLPHVYVLNFETQYELCMSFVRMQEFYESPKFKGKYFTLEQYMDYWSKEFGNGSFTYPAVWNGFNIPGKVLAEWRNACEDNQDVMREREHDILCDINKLMKKDGLIGVDSDDIEKIYIIGTHKGKNSSQVIEHELAHALYYMYPEYRKSCQKLLKKLSKKDYQDAKRLLIQKGYCKQVINDELQAYYSTSTLKKNSDLLGSRVEFVHNFMGFKEKIKQRRNNE